MLFEATVENFVKLNDSKNNTLSYTWYHVGWSKRIFDDSNKFSVQKDQRFLSFGW